MDINYGCYIQGQKLVEGQPSDYRQSRRLADRLGSSFFKPKPKDINFVVVGGETNPIWQSTDYVYYNASVDKWILEDGIKLDEKLIRMPASNTKCRDGLCTFGM